MLLQDVMRLHVLYGQHSCPLMLFYIHDVSTSLTCLFSFCYQFESLAFGSTAMCGRTTFWFWVIAAIPFYLATWEQWVHWRFSYLFLWCIVYSMDLIVNEILSMVPCGTSFSLKSFIWNIYFIIYDCWNGSNLTPKVGINAVRKWGFLFFFF